MGTYEARIEAGDVIVPGEDGSNGLPVVFAPPGFRSVGNTDDQSAHWEVGCRSDYLLRDGFSPLNGGTEDIVPQYAGAAFLAGVVSNVRAGTPSLAAGFGLFEKSPAANARSC